MLQVLALLCVSFFLSFSLVPAVRLYVPRLVRLTLAFSISLVVYESALDMEISRYLIKLSQCVLIGIPIAFACESLVIAGRLIDTARGAQFSEQVIPGVGRSSVLENACRFIAVVWIFVIDYELFIDSFVDIFQEQSRIFELTALSCASFFASSFYAGVLLASPLLALSFLLDISGMLIARVMPRFPVAFELLPIRLILVLFCFSIRLQAEPSCLISLRNEIVSLIGS